MEFLLSDTTITLPTWLYMFFIIYLIVEAVKLISETALWIVSKMFEVKRDGIDTRDDEDPDSS